MNIILELPIKREILDCGPPIGPMLAPYGVNINKVVEMLNNMIEQNKISVHSLVPIEIDLETHKWKFVELHKKVSEQLKPLSRNNKIKYSDLENYVIRTYKTINQEEIDKKLHELTGVCKSMHLEIVK